AMHLADVGVVAWDNVNPDTGTAWEMGYLNAIHKPVVMVCEDEVQTTGINLMLIKGIKAYLKSAVELEKFDFNVIETKLYDGKII
ncbi:nucleoside 2-deoxyribosyltransferase, partial [Lactobacillus sp. XV13L]|nr:nucleoside 2-deoxyribosyltransferase [Lactobacillus sp. XV13L]